MTRIRTGCAAAGCAALIGLLFGAAPARATTPRPRHIVIATVPGLTWEDVVGGKAPAVGTLGARWSMAALSVRTAATPTDEESAMTTIGAGNRARGRTPADNKGLHFGAVTGALSTTLHQHGIRTAASGDATAALAVEPDGGGPTADVAVVAGLTDAGVGPLAGRLDLTQDTLIVLSPSRGTSGSPPAPDRLMVAVVAGVGSTPGGWITSATTHRDGIVTLTDIGPGVLRLLGIPAPPSMTGQPFRTVAAHGARMPVLLGLQSAAVSYAIRVGWFTFGLAVLGFTVVFTGWRSLHVGPGRWSSLIVVGGLLVASAPLACLAQAATGAERWAVLPASAILAAADLAVVGAALAGPWRRHRLGPPTAIAVGTVAAIGFDLVTRSRGQLTSLIGYSPIVGGRFYGLSAVSFAILTTYALVLTGLAAGWLARERPDWQVPAIVAAGVATIALTGAPVLGAKFGSILTLVPGFGLLVLAVSGRRLSLRLVALLAGAAMVAALAIGAVDALRPASSQTHIGRFVGALLGGGAGTGSVATVIQRKLDANLGIFLRAPNAYLVPLALLFVAVVAFRPARDVAAPLQAVPGLRAGVLATIAALSLAMFVNDSGAGIPAMGLAIGTPWVIAMLLPRSRPVVPEAGSIFVAER